MSTSVTQKVSFECCYIVGKYQLNAHRYVLEVCVTGTKKRNSSSEIPGAIIEFSTLERILKSIVPHCKFLYDCSDESEENTGRKVANYLQTVNIAVYGISCSVCAENILTVLVNDLKAELQDYVDVRLESAKLQESSGSYVQWKESFFVSN